MITKNFKPTESQKKWHDEIAAMGCLLSGAHAEIDHLFGSSAKHNGIWIGQHAVVALSPYWHRNGPINRTSSRKQLRAVLSSRMAQGLNYGLEIELFMWQCIKYLRHYNKPLPFDQEIYESILSYQK